MSKIVRALRAIGINVKLIPDIDVMNDERVFREIVESYKISWSSIERDYHIIASNLHNPREKLNREETKKIVNDIFDKAKDKHLLDGEISALNDSIKIVSKWQHLKKMGAAAIPSGDATEAYGRLCRELKTNGIFIVPVGEIEGFIKEVGGHGPGWVENVLERFPDPGLEVYGKIRDFIEGLEL
jgi:predicted DNA-binding protein YlxM (UPF0122 family)